MAQPPDQPQGAAPAAANLVLLDRESSKIPLFYAQKDTDSMTLELWIERVDRVARNNAWTDLQTAGYVGNCLRGKAANSLRLFKMRDVPGNTGTDQSWTRLKAALIETWGKEAKDTSSIANLTLTMRKDEEPPDFAIRVAHAVQEWYDVVNITVPASTFPENEMSQTALGQQTLQRVNQMTQEQRQYYVDFFIMQANHQILNHIATTVFLNGLTDELRLTVKQKSPTDMKEAQKEAVKLLNNIRGPASHTLSLETPAPTKTTAINAIRRGQPRGRGTYPARGRGSFPTSSGNYFRPPSTQECWYCHIKGHTQATCRKRIAKGAAPVKRPRTVQEVETDRILYQEADYDDNVDAIEDQPPEEYEDAQEPDEEQEANEMFIEHFINNIKIIPAGQEPEGSVPLTEALRNIKHHRGISIPSAPLIEHLVEAIHTMYLN